MGTAPGSYSERRGFKTWYETAFPCRVSWCSPVSPDKCYLVCQIGYDHFFLLFHYSLTLRRLTSVYIILKKSVPSSQTSAVTCRYFTIQIKVNSSGA
jgi:hypothetical protein